MTSQTFVLKQLEKKKNYVELQHRIKMKPPLVDQSWGWVVSLTSYSLRVSMDSTVKTAIHLNVTAWSVSFMLLS